MSVIVILVLVVVVTVLVDGVVVGHYCSHVYMMLTVEEMN